MQASLAWEAILAILAIKKDAGYDYKSLGAHITSVPKPHVMAVQFIMVGSGLATPELTPDGKWGEQSSKSAAILYQATQE